MNDERDSREDAHGVASKRSPRISEEQRTSDAEAMQRRYARENAEREAWEAEHPEIVADLKAKQEAYEKEQEALTGKPYVGPNQSLLNDLFGD